MTADHSTRAAIMDATFAALCTHGYADLTMQAIADEFEKSKSLIHYHYDSKDELLTAFMADLLESFVDEVERYDDRTASGRTDDGARDSSPPVYASAPTDTPASHASPPADAPPATPSGNPQPANSDTSDGPAASGDAVEPVDRLRTIADIVVTGKEDSRDFYTALLELRARAPHDEPLREQLVHNDRRIRQLVADVVREGQESGTFRDDVDPETFATVFRSAIEGAQSHEVILGEAAPTDQAMAGVEELLIKGLLVDGGGS